MKTLPTRLATLMVLLLCACSAARQAAPEAQPERPGTVRVREGDGAALVFVPEGRFMMGSSLEMSREAKQLCEPPRASRPGRPAGRRLSPMSGPRMA